MSKWRGIRACMVVVVLTVVAVAAGGAPRYRLRGDLQPGEFFRMHVEYNLMQQGGYGANEPLVHMVTAVGCSVIERRGALARLHMSYDTMAIFSEGLFGVEAASGAALETMDDDITDSDYLLSLMFNALVGIPFTVTIDQRWRVVGVDGIDSLKRQLVERMLRAAGLDNEGLRTKLNDLFDSYLNQERIGEIFSQAVAGFPDKELREGESWHETSSSGTDGLPFSVALDYTLTQVGWAEYEIGVSGTVTPMQDEDGRGVQGTQSGVIVIDRQRGMVLSAAVVQKLQVESGSYGGAVDVQGNLSVVTTFPRDASRLRYRRVLELRDSTYGHSAWNLVVAPLPPGMDSLALLTAEEMRIRELLTYIPGLQSIRSLKDVLLLSKRNNLSFAQRLSDVDAVQRDARFEHLRVRPDVVGRWLVPKESALVMECVWNRLVGRYDGAGARGILFPMNAMTTDENLMIVNPRCAGYCRVTPDTLEGIDAITDELSRMGGAQAQRAQVQRLLGGVTYLEYSFESGQPQGVCRAMFAQRQDDFIRWLEEQEDVVRVSGVHEYLPLFDESNDTAMSRCERLALIDMADPGGGALQGWITPDFSATRIVVRCVDDSAAVSSLWERSLAWLRETRLPK